jgi:hypothetical protein
MTLIPPLRERHGRRANEAANATFLVLSGCIDVRDDLMHGDDAVHDLRTVTMVLGIGVSQPKLKLATTIAATGQSSRVKKSTAIEYPRKYAMNAR